VAEEANTKLLLQRESSVLRQQLLDASEKVKAPNAEPLRVGDVRRCQ
jgi:hypothetical protein